MIKHWLKSLFESENKENISRENNLNNYKPDIVQVDMSIAKKQDQVKKQVDDQLKLAHQFAMIAHEPTCFVFHPTNPLLDCHGQCNYQVTPDKIVGESYTVEERHVYDKSINAVKEKDARLNEDVGFEEFKEKK